MAEAVERVLQQGGLLLVEAGTGTGKTISYLAPAARLRARVVVSTGTKNLQEQIVQKDLPLLARALGQRVNVAVMKGRANYLCKLRFESFSRQGTFTKREEISLLRVVSAWASSTHSGDRAEIRDLPDNADFWRDISATGEQCLGQACAHFDDCWVTEMRRRALEAEVVVVNHHLLCADLALDEEPTERTHSSGGPSPPHVNRGPDGAATRPAEICAGCTMVTPIFALGCGLSVARAGFP
jgi:ATP-dependent DNA helicase DinG